MATPSRFIAPTRPKKNTNSKVKSEIKESSSYEDLSVVILGSIPNHKMRSYGPKPFIKVNGITILDNIIEQVNSKFPGCEILLTVGYYADKIMKYIPDEIRIIENQLFDNTNTVEECRLALNATLNKRILIIDSDVFFNEAALPTLNKSSIIIDKKEQLGKNDVGTTIVDNKVTIFSFGIPTKWCNIVYLTDKELRTFKSIIASPTMKRCFMFEALNKLVNKVDLYAVEPPDMEIIKIDSSKDL